MAETKVKKDAVAEAILQQLKDPFDPNLIKFRPTGGRAAAYIDARDVMKRLDTVMGTENWRDKYISVEGGFVCELSLRINGEWIAKSNGANNTKVEPVKGGISSAFKRAAVNWGVGRYLYYMPASLNGSNIASWPAIFKPGAPKDWEEIAQAEAEEDTGMDEDMYTDAIMAGANAQERISGAQTLAELKEVVDSLDSTTERLMADIIANKTDELIK